MTNNKQKTVQFIKIQLVEFETKEITLGEKTVIVQICDTGGQEAYRSIPKIYYRKSHGYIFVYDITNYQSFEEIASWQEDVFNNCKPKVQFILIGNKKDKEDYRKVSVEIAKKYAKENNMSFLETSAKDNINVGKAFLQVLEQCVENNVFEIFQATNDRKPVVKSCGLIVNGVDEKNNDSGKCC
ncbi:hypothetical protein M0813_22931 [Anaeramoeba flamelloides]|uniref:Uncharacterized protein n=1 Tax=Anaeramoeba flamelloides TaxID=1746091 RepID=A0ABQ8YC21_9EUKA|nr:hypothetical protein M0813_22931 [Anaeramoeba flamelloides]